MSDDKDKKISKSISLEDSVLWESMTYDVHKLPGKAYVKGEKPEVDVDDTFEGLLLGGGEIITPSKKVPSVRIARGQDLDARTDERLRKGQIPIEARLDLHGFRQDEAKSALVQFIQASQKSGKRCVLVITGKGSTRAQSDDWWGDNPGVLKRQVPEWLSAEHLRPYLLKFVPAQRKDGGEGALYVYLRRNRDF